MRPINELALWMRRFLPIRPKFLHWKNKTWRQQDAGEMQVIAAAAGTIVAYGNVNPADHNCGPNSSGNWNYIALVYADGRMTIYGYMRYNSLTPKSIGQRPTWKH